MAGQLKRENPTIDEDLVLIRALRDSNLPKFLADDAILFKVNASLGEYKCQNGLEWNGLPEWFKSPVLLSNRASMQGTWLARVAMQYLY